jgi:AAA domain/TrwC relaxase
VPYFDLTVSAVKSVSVLHASYQVCAWQARNRGDDAQAAVFDARAGELEDALMESAREAVSWLDRHAAYTRTGHHSAQSGEWRDGAGLVASLFLHHLSRDGDPQLHVHVAIWNRVQRADGADDKWRTLDSRTLHSQRLGVAPVADRILETRLTALGYVIVPRADGNGAEIGGIPQDVMDLFSSRSVAVTGETERLAREYETVHGKPPSRRTLWLLHQQAGQNTRRTKTLARRTLAGQTGTTEPTAAQRLAAWQAQTVDRELRALSAVHEQVTQFASVRADSAPAALGDAAKRTAARIAVAEVQTHHAVWSMAQLRFEVHRALPVLPPGTDGEQMVTEVARLAVSGRSGAEVVQVIAPDITDVTGLGVRASDGGSIYRPPNAERYCTLAHLDAEEQILAAAKRTVPQLVSEQQARAAAARTDLSAEQRDAVTTMLTAATAAAMLIAPAGAGKSHTMAEFARLWTMFTGRRVIGLTTSTNAARVLAHEGLAESYNIAAFLGKIEGSGQLRRPVPLHQDDVLVLDEASQLGTADLAMITEAACQAGARIIATGDTAQLGAVQAGGMFRLLASEVPTAELHEVRRFAAQWEREASVRLRDGDPAAVAVYDRHGRIRSGDHEAACERAASIWLAEHLCGKDVLLAGSNAEAADLSRRVQAKLTQLGRVGQPQAILADGNHTGVGDLIRARLNTKIDAGGQQLSNRDTLKVIALHGVHAEIRRQCPDGAWTAAFRVPRSYLADHAELAYAGNVHVAQGRIVDTAHLLVTESLSRQALYVGMTRGRESNTAHVVTGQTAPPDREPYQQAAPEAVLVGVIQRDDGDLSATEQIRQAQDWASGTGRLLTLWTAAVRQTLYPDIDQQIKARLTDSEAWRYDREHSCKVLQQQLRTAQLAGHYISALINQITDPKQAVSFLPHRSSPELEDMRLAAIRALEIRDENDIIHGMTHGELEARTLEAERAQASAPPDVSRQLRLTAQAEADAWQQSADVATRHDHTRAANAKTLASQLAAERQQLEAANTRYEQWSAATTSTRETAAKARAELELRGLAREQAEPSQPRAVNEPEADNAVDPNIDRAYQVAAGMYEPQPPERALTPQYDSAAAQEPDGRLSPDHQVARADELLAQAAAAAGRIAAEHAERQARAEYTARADREAQAQWEPTLERQAQYDVEMEL